MQNTLVAGAEKIPHVWWWMRVSVSVLLLIYPCAGMAGGTDIPGIFTDIGQKRSTHDVLVSIEHKLSSLDSFVEAMRLSGMHYSLANLERRLNGIEATVSQMDIKLQTRLDKLYEVLIGRDARDRAGNELGRKMDAAAEKIITKVGVLEAKSSLRADNVIMKMDRMERNLGEMLGDVLEKLTKAAEKNAQMEGQWIAQSERIERVATANCDDLKEEMASFLTTQFGNSHTADGNSTTTMVTKETDAKFLPDSGHNQQKINKQSWVTSSSSHEAAADTPSIPTESETYWQNVSATLDEALLVGQKKFHELDDDIEMYTRKVLNAYQELLKESKGIEDYLNKVIDHDNQTRNVVREGFRKLFHQMKPLSTLEEILQSLRKKVAEMGSTVDTSFASLLVAQNTFIATCHRIQHQEPQIETKIYHLLQKLMAGVEERSAKNHCNGMNETSFWESFESYKKDVGRALHDLVWTVITVGNQTVVDLERTLEQFRRKNACQCNPDNVQVAGNLNNTEFTANATLRNPSPTEHGTSSTTTDLQIEGNSTIRSPQSRKNATGKSAQYDAHIQVEITKSGNQSLSDGDSQDQTV